MSGKRDAGRGKRGDEGRGKRDEARDGSRESSRDSVAGPSDLDSRAPLTPAAEETQAPKPHGDPLRPEVESVPKNAKTGQKGGTRKVGVKKTAAIPAVSVPNETAEAQPVTTKPAVPADVERSIAKAPQADVAPGQQRPEVREAGEGRSESPEGQRPWDRPSAQRVAEGSRPKPAATQEQLRRELPPGTEAVLEGDSANPHAVLGAHPATFGGRSGVVIRAMMPNASWMECVLEDGRTLTMEIVGEGTTGSRLFALFVPDATLPLRYRLRFHFPDGAVWDRDDPYRFLPTIGDVDLYLFNEGTHRELWAKLGAHPRTMDGVAGASFAVWAPNARRVSVVGDFCGWDGRVFPMRSMGASGVFEVFIPDIGPGALYKYELVTPEGMLRLKSDPFAFKMEQYPGTASIVEPERTYEWRDETWMTERRSAPATELYRAPMSIYEVHLGSWARVPEEGNRTLTYREIAPRLAEHVKRLGFTHIEMLPVMEHPFYGSWGYQVSGYYSPTSRYGTPDEFREFVDVMHQHGIGVILDWVPAHFPKDDYALRRFDGTALYEHEDPRLGEHPDWGTLIFNYGRNEVRNYLVANALYWLKEFHADGLRVDAVASMLYLDYSREQGEWVQNRYGGRENLEAIDFLRQFNDTIHAEAPGCCTIAEESTAWPGVTKPTSEGGLGFTFKWNMGWMHDTLLYFSKDPIHRRFHQDQLTFAMIYEYSEHFIMPLSHDEVVHLKGSLLSRMPGDDWQKLANLRLLLAYMYTRPGKKLLFMGTELAPYGEWAHETSLDWHLRDDPRRAGLQEYMRRLGAIYRERPAFWREDASWEGFRWIDTADRENSVIAYERRAGDEEAVVVLNFTPVPREQYRIGVPRAGRYRVLLTSDALEWGGSGYMTPPTVDTEPAGFHGHPQSVVLALPPLGAMILVPE